MSAKNIIARLIFAVVAACGLTSCATAPSRPARPAGQAELGWYRGDPRDGAVKYRVSVVDIDGKAPESDFVYLAPGHHEFRFVAKTDPDDVHNYLTTPTISFGFDTTKDGIYSLTPSSSDEVTEVALVQSLGGANQKVLRMWELPTKYIYWRRSVMPSALPGLDAPDHPAGFAELGWQAGNRWSEVADYNIIFVEIDGKTPECVPAYLSPGHHEIRFFAQSKYYKSDTISTNIETAESGVYSIVPQSRGEVVKVKLVQSFGGPDQKMIQQWELTTTLVRPYVKPWGSLSAPEKAEATGWGLLFFVIRIMGALGV